MFGFISKISYNLLSIGEIANEREVRTFFELKDFRKKAFRLLNVWQFCENHLLCWNTHYIVIFSFYFKSKSKRAIFLCLASLLNFEIK